MQTDSDIYDDLRDFEASRWEVTTTDVQGFQEVLASATNERPLQAYLQHHPQLLCAYLRSGHGEWVIRQKRLGAEYVPDFVIGCGNSGGFIWDFIELESPTAALTLANGQPARGLRSAVHQIECWRDWLKDNLDYARRGHAINGLGLRDVHPQANAKIVIGRRENSTPAHKRLKTRYREQYDVDIMSYDRLLENFESINGIIRRCRGDA